MKSLILKDLYNIGHNIKSMLFILLVLGVVFISISSVGGYIFTASFLCFMMIMTTFAFDDASKWARYAMITPITKKELVAGKFFVLAIFCAAGTVFGLLTGLAGGMIAGRLPATFTGISELLVQALAAFAMSMVFGSMSIPLIFKFGAEKGRSLILVSFLIPAGICYLAYRLLLLLGIEMTDQFVFGLLCCSPVIALAWCFLMYRISYRIFSGQEL